MPLRCLDDRAGDVFAFAHDAAGWAALVADNKTRRHLRTRCCDAAVVPKVSRLGTRFFAHKVGGGCATGDESPEHLHLKMLAVAAAQAHGWTAETEVAAADGAWRADVLASRGRHRVAVEVQWSPQDDAETLRRQARYAAAGIRALWLFRQPRFPASADVPAVRVRGSLKAGFTALGLPVAAVLDAAFGGRLRFGIPAWVVARVVVDGVAMACWGCGALNRAVAAVRFEYAASTAGMSLAVLGDYPALTASVLRALPPDPMRGAIKPRFDTATGRRCLSSGCLNCDRRLGTPVSRATARSGFRVASFTLAIDAAAAVAIADAPEAHLVWSVAPAPASD